MAYCINRFLYFVDAVANSWIQLIKLFVKCRSLAETRYQLGVAYTFTTDFQEAIRNFKAAAAIIKTRIENLKWVIEYMKRRK